MILLNGISIGAQAQHMVLHLQEEVPPALRIVDFFFGVVWCMELCLRLFVFRHRLFVMPGWSWNLFDLMVVLFRF